MLKQKQFKTLEQANQFIEKNAHRLWCDILFINNGYIVEYKKLIRVY